MKYIKSLEKHFAKQQKKYSKGEIMDFSKLNMTEHADKGAKMQVMHPSTGEPLEGVTITLLGDDSTVQRLRLAELRQKALAKKGNFNKIYDLTEEHSQNIRISKTIGWEGVVWEGKELACTPENVRKIYSNDGFRWLVDQVDRFTVDRSNFLESADNS